MASAAEACGATSPALSTASVACERQCEDKVVCQDAAILARREGVADVLVT